jgi:hypothetical protein
MLLWAARAILGFQVCGVAGVRKVWTYFCENVERMVELEASQASAGSQLSNALLPVAIRCVWGEIWLFLWTFVLHAISTMSPCSARCAPTGSNASLVHHYGLPTAWGAPACLHAAACAHPQQCDAEHAARRSQRQGPTAPRIECVYCHGSMQKPRGGAAGGSGRHISKGRRSHPRPIPCVY